MFIFYFSICFFIYNIDLIYDFNDKINLNLRNLMDLYNVINISIIINVVDKGGFDNDK